MSYQVLARKWRPSNFSQVAGQSHVLKSLVNALDNKRLHHAYLFSGTRGVGKTTLARILAKCLNCEQEITSQPCEQCSACQEISAGRFVDLIEVDAASRTKVEEMRELLENVQYLPARGRFKIYLIDEVHMLSNHSFNALLKTLEEPPEHVKFLFATTDPQKLPITILSRCLQFTLKNLSPQIIEQQLEKILKQEQVEYDVDALWQLAAVAAGSMRDALTLADQAIAFCQGNVSKEGVIEMLGVPEQQQVLQLLDAMADRDVARLLELVEHISDQAANFAHTLDILLSALHRIAIAQVLPAAVDNSFGDREQVAELAARFTAEDVQLYYQLGSQGREDLGQAAELRSAFEMLLLRMLVFSPEFAAPASESTSQPGASRSSATPKGDSSAGVQKKKTAPPARETETAPDPSRPDAPPAPGPETEQAADPFLPDGPPAPTAETEPVTDTLQTAATTGRTSDTERATGSSRPDEPPAPTSETEPVTDTLQTAATTGRTSETERATDPSRPAASPAPANEIPAVTDSLQPAATAGPASQTNAIAVTSKTAAQPDASLEGTENEFPGLDALDHGAWLELYGKLGISGIAANVLANSQLQKIQGQTLYFILDSSQSAVFNQDQVPRIARALSESLLQELQVNFTVGEVSAETPAARSQRLRIENQRALVQGFESDGNVRELVKQFSGTVATDTIKPLND